MNDSLDRVFRTGDTINIDTDDQNALDRNMKF